MSEAMELLKNSKKLKSLATNISKLAIADSADRIVDQIEKQFRKQ